MQALNISLGQCGSVTIQTKFLTSDELRKFERSAKTTLEELKDSLAYSENHYVGVFVYAYEAEATDTSITVN